MKYIKFIVAISFMLASVAAFACGPIFYYPSEYYLFRIPDLPKANEGGFNINRQENCLQWQCETSSSIPVSDIYQVVYKYDLETLVALKSGNIPQIAKGNEMARWLVAKKDWETLDYLIMAKNCEWLRFQQCSPWYYPSKSDPVKFSLNDVADVARRKTEGEYADRYALQAVRAMTSLRQYEEIVSFWNEVESRIPEGLMRRMILPYVGGACVHLDNLEQAKAYYKQADDIAGMLECDLSHKPIRSSVGRMEAIFDNYPDYPGFRSMIWSILGRIEPDKKWESDNNWAWDETEKEKIRELGLLCDKVLGSDAPADKALWAYTATYIAHLQGDDKKADRYLKVAEKSVTDKNFADVIKVMRIYIDAQNSTYDKAYEQKLFGQLRWLQQMIENNLDDELTDNIDFWELELCFSFYYWNDAMRCILLGTVCPKLIEQGNSILALQLANMACYSYVNVVNKAKVELWRPEDIQKYGGEDVVLNMDQYRRSTLFNCYDYCCQFAEMMDTLSANTLIAYTDIALKPQTDFQRFLNAHSYTDNNYLNEIVGTHLLREMRYAEAERYLAKVAPDYYLCTNVYKEHYLNRNPFSVKQEIWNHGSDAKLQFARTMNRLEQDIAATADPNLKAMLMLDFGIGLRNSFDYCWALTHYRQDWRHDFRIDDPNSKLAMKRVKQLFSQALNAFTDDEYAAQAQLLFGNYKTIIQRYSGTEVGLFVEARCDRYCDYHIEGKGFAYLGE